MSEMEKEKVLEMMDRVPEEDKRYLLGVMAGLVAKGEKQCGGSEGPENSTGAVFTEERAGRP